MVVCREARIQRLTDRRSSKDWCRVRSPEFDTPSGASALPKDKIAEIKFAMRVRLIVVSYFLALHIQVTLLVC